MIRSVSTLISYSFHSPSGLSAASRATLYGSFPGFARQGLEAQNLRELTPPRQVSRARGFQNALACTFRPSSTTMCSEGSLRRRSSIIKSYCYDYWGVEPFVTILGVEF